MSVAEVITRHPIPARRLLDERAQGKIRRMPYIIGIDTGGTFTDCVVMDADGRLVTAKAPSTPDDFSEGVMESLRLAGERLSLTTEALLRDTARLALGTTVGTNAMLQRRGARVGLITTRGHRDVIHIMRGARGVPGLNNVQVLHFPESGKPDPIVPKPFIAEVSERVDCKGQVVVELNEDEARQAIEKLVAKGVEAIDRKSTRLNSSHLVISYAVFCLKKKNNKPALPTCSHIGRCSHTQQR